MDKKTLAIAIVVVLVVAGLTAVLAKSDNANANAKGQDTAPKVTGMAVAKGNEKAPVAISVDTDDEDEEEPEEEPDEDDEAIEKIIPGRLISEAQRTRRDIFKETKDILKDAGYKGPMNEFATSYNVYVKSLKDEIRAKIATNITENLTQEIVREVAERELARIREEILEGLNLTEEEIDDGIINGTNETNETDGNETDNETEEIITAELSAMSPSFKTSLYGVAVLGSEEEKEDLAEQFEEYAEIVSGEEEIEPVEIDDIDLDEIREQLEEGASIEEIANAITE